MDFIFNVDHVYEVSIVGHPVGRYNREVNKHTPIGGSVWSKPKQERVQHIPTYFIKTLDIEL